MGCGASVKKRYSFSKDDVIPLEWSPNRRASGTAHVIIRNKCPICEVYDMQKDPLSKGTFSKVRLGTHRETFVTRAVKCIAKPRQQKRNQFSDHVTSSEDVENEVKIMGKMDHPNIVRAFETFEDSLNHYLVMEYCSGGAVLEVLATLEEFTERQAAVVMQQALRGIAYMHKLSIVHRDVRPSNLLLAKTTMVQDSTIKVCDLGSACFFDDDIRLRKVAGEKYYSAPEVDGKQFYNELVDAWSSGVVVFTLLCGYPSLPHGSTKEHMIKAAKGAFMWTKADWQQVCSKSARSLLDQLLEPDPQVRLSVEKAQKHDWIKRQGGGGADAPMGVGRIKTLRERTQVTNLKKRAQQVVAQRLDANQIRKLQDALRAFDVSANGIITHKELSNALGSMGRIHEDVSVLVADLQINDAMPIDYTEFISLSLQQRQYNSELICAEAFRKFDPDNIGTIPKRNIKKILSYLADRVNVSQAEMDAIVKECEKDKDREAQLDFNDILLLLRGER